MSAPRLPVPLHLLGVQVDDLEVASAHAEACGAPASAVRPRADVRVQVGPAGHPFCLGSS